MRTCINEHRHERVPMVPGHDQVIFEIPGQHEDGSLTMRVKSRLLTAIRSRRSGVSPDAHRYAQGRSPQGVLTMQNCQEFQHCVIGVNRHGAAVLVEGPPAGCYRSR
jgi:hypothetical protein